MSTFQDILNLVTPLAPADKVKEMVELLKTEDKQFLFRYGTVDEIVAFPHQQLKNPVKLQHHLFIKGVFEEAKRRECVWTLWEIWRKQPNFRAAIDMWFVRKVAVATEYGQFAHYLPFISPQMMPVVYEIIFSIVTPQVLAERWTHYEWLSFERIFVKPEKGDEDDVRERYERGQQLFKSAAALMDTTRYQEFKARIVSPVSLKFGGTDLSLLFRT